MSKSTHASMAQQDSSELKLPGFDIPYTSMPKECFGSALNDYRLSMTTLREFTMMKLMNEITDKHDWHKKVFNDDITKKWKKEAMETGLDVTQAMVDWCIDELRYKAKHFEATGFVTAYDADVVKSDTAIPEDLKAALKNAVKPLEDVPDSEKDWHPGSDEKVLDLVHPSLFPLVYGCSRILPDSTTNLDDFIDRCGEGITLSDATAIGDDGRFSKKFQWLPCNVDISEDEPKITSYINNLPPRQYKDLYAIIEKFIGCAIPLWNATLAPQKAPKERKNRIVCDPEVTAIMPGQQEGESREAFYVRFRNWTESVIAEQPDVGTFTPAFRSLQDDETLKPNYSVDLKRDFSKQGLQIIVKLANIHLTPEKPEYNGGTWHVEGQLNEHICATAIYYYDCENVSSSSLAFRQIVDPEEAVNFEYEQNYHTWLTDLFGCKNEEAPIQFLGSVDTKEGRLLTFPNILLHKVNPFKLADPTRPGHRKILALFLVDPYIRIISTANIPCQRLDWWREALEAKQTELACLPLELKDQIFNQVEDFPIPMERAKALRLELMEERKNFAGFENELEPFSLCEH